MPLLDSKQQRAAFLILLLGVGIAFALTPYVTGMIGALVFYVTFAPMNDHFRKTMKPGLAAGIVVAIVLLVLVLPSIPLSGAIIGQAHDLAQSVVSSGARSPLLERVSDLRIGTYDVGPR